MLLAEHSCIMYTIENIKKNNQKFFTLVINANEVTVTFDCLKLVIIMQ